MSRHSSSPSPVRMDSPLRSPTETPPRHRQYRSSTPPRRLHGRSRSPRDRPSSLERQSRSRSPHRSRTSHSPRRHRHRTHSRSRSRARSQSRKERSGGHQNCRVYVGNLSFDTNWRHLKDYMRKAGSVVNADVLESSSRRSKGCGVVEFKYPEDAQRAIQQLNETHFMGRTIFVREDREMSGDKPLYKDPNEAPEECRLFVGNLPYSASWQDMKDLFKEAGRVLHTDVHTEPDSRRSKGTGQVIFNDARDARKAIDRFNDFEWRGRRLEVYEESKRGKRQRSSAGNASHDGSRTDHDHRSGYVRSQVTQRPLQNDSPGASPVVTWVSGPGALSSRTGTNQIFVKNLPYLTTSKDLIDLFRHAGPVVRSEILTVNDQQERPNGSGLVRFEDMDACKHAIAKFNGYLYGGRDLDVRLDKFSH